MRRIRLLALLLVLCVPIAACGGDDAPALDGPVIREPQSENPDSMAAEIGGRLELDGDCLYLAGEERFPIVWPAGTTWDAEQSEVVTADGARIALGQEFSGGGGHLSVDNVRRALSDEVGDHAAACADNTDGYIAVVQYAIAIGSAA